MPRKKRVFSKVVFHLIPMQCCGQLLCWVNPRFPNYCPECGKYVFPDVRGWPTVVDETARLSWMEENTPSQTVGIGSYFVVQRKPVDDDKTDTGIPDRD
jgi:hypothetical protein